MKNVETIENKIKNAQKHFTCQIKVIIEKSGKTVNFSVLGIF